MRQKHISNRPAVLAFALRLPSLLSQTTHSDSLAKKIDPSHSILADW
jgi:hypothetical protein